jgi:uncharacterized membrane protein
MQFCVHCGNEVHGRFCSKCGNAVPGAATSAGGPSAGSGLALGGLDENIVAALCYLLGVLTGILFLVLEPYNKNRTIRFHAFQSIFAWVAVVVASIGISIVSGIWALVPYAGWMINSLLWSAFALAVFILWLLLMYKAYNKERWVLPVIGPLAEKQV